MESKPLLSDERLIGYVTVANGVQMMKMNRMTPVEVCDFYEAARAEDAKLIVQLVDALKIHDEARAVMTPQDINLFRVKYDIQEGRVSDWLREIIDNALSAAAARNFKPTEQP